MGDPSRRKKPNRKKTSQRSRKKGGKKRRRQGKKTFQLAVEHLLDQAVGRMDGRLRRGKTRGEKRKKGRGKPFSRLVAEYKGSRGMSAAKSHNRYSKK